MAEYHRLVIVLEGDNREYMEEALAKAVRRVEELRPGAEVYRAWVEPEAVQASNRTLREELGDNDETLRQVGIALGEAAEKVRVLTAKRINRNAPLLRPPRESDDDG